MSSDRLNELLRQRALAQQQLDWLDREIAALKASTAPQPAVVAPAKPTPAVTAADAAAEDFLEYKPNPEATAQAARRGCLRYAVLAFVLLIGTLLLIYFVHYRDHPLLFAPSKSAPVESDATTN